MADKLKVVFMFWAAGADPAKHRVTFSLESVDVIAVGVGDYEQAVEVSRQLVAEGASAIELCAGFGNLGVAKVASAVKGVPVGVVKFDIHPLMGCKSGDQELGLLP
jgi:hypothetical protein